MSIDPGLYRAKLTYQAAASATDTIGYPASSWSDVTTVWARVEPLSGREQWYATQIHATTTHKVTFRYNQAVNPLGRFRIFGTDRYLNISGVTDFEERHVEMVALCTEAIGD